MAKRTHIKFREGVQVGRGPFDMVHPATAFAGIDSLKQFVSSECHCRSEYLDCESIGRLG